MKPMRNATLPDHRYPGPPSPITIVSVQSSRGLVVLSFSLSLVPIHCDSNNDIDSDLFFCKDFPLVPSHDSNNDNDSDILP